MASKRRIRRNSCDGKIQHKTSNDGRLAIINMAKKFELNGWVNVYKCKFCKQYHIGRAPSWKK